MSSVTKFLRRRWPVLAGVAVLAGIAVVVVNAVSPLICGTRGAGIGCATRTMDAPVGGSIVLATGKLTGRTATVDESPEVEFELDHVSVLAGVDQPSTVRGWLRLVPDPSINLAAAQVPGLWAKDGYVLAYVPKNASTASSGAQLHFVPVVGQAVVFSAADCGSAPVGLHTTAFTGPLNEVPNSYSYQVARCNGGFHEAPLTAVRSLLPSR